MDFEEEITKRKIYDFESSYKENFLLEAKKTYQRICLENKTLSKEFKAHIKNINNINVDLKYHYDYIIYISWVEIQVSYEYTGSYRSGYNVVDRGSYYSVDSSYTTSTFNRSTNITLYSKNSSPYTASLGLAHYNKNNVHKFVDLTNSSATKMPAGLYSISEVMPSDSEINERLRETSRWEYDAKNYIEEVHGDNPKKLKVTKVNDYSIGHIELYYMPSSVEIATTFKGKVYKQNAAIVPDGLWNVEPKGEQSDHFVKYEREMNEIKTKKSIVWVPRLLMALCCPLPLYPFGLEAIGISVHMREITFWPLNGLGCFVLFALSLFWMWISGMEFTDIAPYNENKPVSELRDISLRNYRWKLVGRIALCLLWIVIVLIFTNLIWLGRVF